MVLNVNELAALESDDPTASFAAIAEERAALNAQYRDPRESKPRRIAPPFAKVSPARMAKMQAFAASIFKNTRRSALERRGMKNASVPRAECDDAAALFARFAAAGAANARSMRELCAVDAPPPTRADVVATMRACKDGLDAQIAESARLRAADGLPMKVGSTPARSAWEVALATTPLADAPATFSAFHRGAASAPKPRGCGRIVTKQVPLTFVDLFDPSITFTAVAATTARKYAWIGRAIAVDSDPMVRLRSLPRPGAAARVLDILTPELVQRFLDACRSWAQASSESSQGLFHEAQAAQRLRATLVRVWRQKKAPRLRHGFLVPESSQFDVRRPLSRAASQALSQAAWTSAAVSRADSKEGARAAWTHTMAPLKLVSRVRQGRGRRLLNLALTRGEAGHAQRTQAVIEEQSAPIDASGVAAAAVAEVSTSLPTGWVERTHPSNGKTYYANLTTGESAWARPAGTAPTAMGAVADAALPAGWKENTDQSGRHYYTNAATSESTWTRPVAAWARPAGTAPTTMGAAADAALPAGWKENTDQTGRHYYTNAATSESTWTRPVATSRDTTTISVYDQRSGQSLEVDVCAEDTILAVKRLLISKHGGVAPQYQRLIFQGDVLDDDESVEGSGLESGTTVMWMQSAPTAAALPAGWQEHADPSGRKYYTSAAGQSTWERPAAAVAAVAALPTGWVERTHPTNGKTYYANATTGTSSWTRPE
jgi:hypothetical protein